MTLYINSQRNLRVRDNSGVKRIKRLLPIPQTNSKLKTRVITELKTQSQQSRKNLETGKLVRFLLVNTRARMKGKNGVLRRNQTTTVVVVNETRNLSSATLTGTRISTKLPKSMYGKGRRIRKRVTDLCCPMLCIGQHKSVSAL